MDSVAPYTLPDSELMASGSTIDFKIWQPDSDMIVLGASNRIDESVYTERAKRDGIAVLKRPSGGETVLLSPKTLCISIAVKRGQALSPKRYFQVFNEIIIGVLRGFGVLNLGMKGISDISIGERKILGSAIYQNKDKILYHAVLNMAEDTEKIEKYLKHPKREPDYRLNRRHRDFVTSLVSQGYVLSIESIQMALEKQIREEQFGAV